MQCHQCQGEHQKGDRFCESCGANLETSPKKSPQAAAPKKAKSTTTKPTAKRSADRPARRRPPQQENSRPKGRRRRDSRPTPDRRQGQGSKGMWIGATAIMLVIGVLVYWQKTTDEARHDTSRGSVRAPAQGVARPGGAPVGGSTPMALEAPRIPSNMDISGTISLDPSLKDKVPSQGAFYIMARLGNTTKGPPIAAVKLPASAEPTSFVIGPGDLMMGGDFNQPVTLTVRWDQDGDPLTRQATDLVATSITPVKPGTKDLKMVLNSTHGTDEAKTPLNLDEPESQPASIPAPEGQPAANDAPPAPAAGATGDITGLVRVDPALTRPANGIIYIIARLAGSKGGPPLAAKRVAIKGTGDIPFSIGQGDVMMGSPFNQPVTLSVRWDQDGNAMSKQPGDLVGTAPAALNPGTQNVIITLNQKL